MGGQIVRFGIAADDEHGVDAADAGVARIVEDGVVHSTCVQRSDPIVRARPQVVDVAEENRSGRTRRRARRLQAHLLPVVTERALERAAIVGPSIDDAERAPDHAVAAAVADVGLHVDVAELGADDRSRWTRFEAAGILAVLTHVGREAPRHLVAGIAADAERGGHLDELDVPPGRVAEVHRVVVGMAAPVEAIRRHLIPFLAGDLAGLAADAERRISEKRRGRHASGLRDNRAPRNRAAGGPARRGTPAPWFP
jgi:hypothetical protein